MTPSRASVVVANESTSQGAFSKQGSLISDDRAAGRIEPVPVQTEIEAVVLGVAIIDLRKQSPVVTKTRIDSQTRMNRVQSIGDSLKINRVGCVRGRR